MTFLVNHAAHRYRRISEQAPRGWQNGSPCSTPTRPEESQCGGSGMNHGAKSPSRYRNCEGCAPRTVCSFSWNLEHGSCRRQCCAAHAIPVWRPCAALLRAIPLSGLISARAFIIEATGSGIREAPPRQLFVRSPGQRLPAVPAWAQIIAAMHFSNEKGA